MSWLLACFDKARVSQKSIFVQCKEYWLKGRHNTTVFLVVRVETFALDTFEGFLLVSCGYRLGISISCTIQSTTIMLWSHRDCAIHIERARWYQIQVGLYYIMDLLDFHRNKYTLCRSLKSNGLQWLLNICQMFDLHAMPMQCMFAFSLSLSLCTLKSSWVILR